MLDVRVLEQIINCRDGALQTINIKELSVLKNIQDVYKEIERKVEMELTNEMKQAVLIYFQEQTGIVIETTVKPAINEYVETDTKPKIEQYVNTVVDNLDKTEMFTKLEEKLNVHIETVSKPSLGVHVDTVSKPTIDTYTTKQEARLQALIDSNAVQGNLIFQTIAERDQYVQDNVNFPEKVFIGLTVFIIDELMNYFYKGNGAWGKFHSSATVHIGPEPPNDTSLLWINPEEEDIDQMLDSAILDEFRATIRDLTGKITTLEYAINKAIDPGVFDPPIENEDGTTTPFPKSVEKVKVKRGAKRYLVDANLSDGEMAFLKDTKELVIYSDGKIINVSSSESGGNLSGQHLDLIAPNKTKYRITINNTGNFVIYRAELDEAPDPKPADSGNFKGLLINQIYGGGTTSDAVISHDFIELYNNTNTAKNLKGLSIQYGTSSSPWQVLELKGEVLPFSSFLIRCGANKLSEKQLYKIDEYDIDWNVKLSDKGMKVFLTVGRNICTVKNPFNYDGAGNKNPGYIDLIGVAGIDKTRVIDAYEKTMKHIMNKNTSARRHDFNDSDDHHTDIKAIDFTTPTNKIYLPRCSADGSWDVSFDKDKIDTEKPSLISMTFGKNAENSRCFTWQSPTTNTGNLYYCKKALAMTAEGAEFISVASSVRQIQHMDCDATVHSVILRNLDVGTYVYRVSFQDEFGNAKFSPLREFTLKSYNTQDKIKIIQTTDQQSWDEHEYECWKYVNQILDNKYPTNTYDFRMNTGDISQNANRAFEWRYYFKHAQETLATQVEVTTVGNNDLIDKLYTEAWTYYYTYEESPLPSVYSFDIGYCHFVSLDAWVGLAHHFVEVPSPTPEDPNATKKVDMHLQRQLEWLDQDLASTNKRWKIVYMHLSPYTISVNAKQVPFAKIFEKHGVQLVICGHNHCYSRSLPIKGYDPNGTFNGKKGVPIVNEAEGAYYILCQASGYKLEGKDKPKPNTPWIPTNEDTVGGTEPKNPCWTPDQPCYIEWEIGYDQIKMKSYMLKGLINKDPQFAGTPQEYNPTSSVEDFLYDTVTINHR
ncbi:metallophosphoesterase [Cetobacterium sp.]|uniref:metallophosphoesterase n=1 Tax=Cetobacterium sp. TaxID=2071632 RepID=UPI003F37D1CA